MRNQRVTSSVFSCSWIFRLFILLVTIGGTSARVQTVLIPKAAAYAATSSNGTPAPSTFAPTHSDGSGSNSYSSHAGTYTTSPKVKNKEQDCEDDYLIYYSKSVKQSKSADYDSGKKSKKDSSSKSKSGKKQFTPCPSKATKATKKSSFPPVVDNKGDDGDDSGDDDDDNNNDSNNDNDNNNNNNNNNSNNDNDNDNDNEAQSDHEPSNSKSPTAHGFYTTKKEKKAEHRDKLASKKYTSSKSPNTETTSKPPIKGPSKTTKSTKNDKKTKDKKHGKSGSSKDKLQKPTMPPIIAPTTMPPTTMPPTTMPPSSSPSETNRSFPTFQPDTESPTTASPTFPSPTTISPSLSDLPSLVPSPGPSDIEPTLIPTSANPSSSPSTGSSAVPSLSPSAATTTLPPSLSPAANPTVAPTPNPTKSPTTGPTRAPSRLPTRSPTRAPATLSPSSFPTTSSTPEPTPSPTPRATPAPTPAPIPINFLEGFPCENSLFASINANPPDSPYPRFESINPSDPSSLCYLRMTADNEQDTAASAFLGVPVNDPTQFSFAMTIGYRLYGAEDEQADGMVFVMQQDVRGATALGNTGGGIGVYGTPEETIKPALAIEWDTFDNPNRLDRGRNNIHVVQVDRNAVLSELLQSQNENIRTDDLGNTVGRMWVEYNCNGNRNLDVTFNNTGSDRPRFPNLRLSNVRLEDFFFQNGDQVLFVGYTASVGGSSDNHDIFGWEFTQGC
ncbi:hypothetical protein ACA910_004302 [Epithemia clementina (nom. ined.)]